MAINLTVAYVGDDDPLFLTAAEARRLRDFLAKLEADRPEGSLRMTDPSGADTIEGLLGVVRPFKQAEEVTQPPPTVDVRRLLSTYDDGALRVEAQRAASKLGMGSPSSMERVRDDIYRWLIDGAS